MKDLALLTADKNMDFAMRGILARPEALGIRSVSYEIRQHGGHDGGMRTTGPETLALLRQEFHYGLVMLDWEGSGSEAEGAIALELELESRLSSTWGNQAKAIVIDPELDIWIWGSNNAMSQVLEWSEGEGIRAWLAGRQFEFDERKKPIRPKEALDEVMLRLNEPRSSVIYERMTRKISLARCVDPAFNRLKATLQSWFPP